MARVWLPAARCGGLSQDGEGPTRVIRNVNGLLTIVVKRQAKTAASNLKLLFTEKRKTKYFTLIYIEQFLSRTKLLDRIVNYAQFQYHRGILPRLEKLVGCNVLAFGDHPNRSISQESGLNCVR